MSCKNDRDRMGKEAQSAVHQNPSKIKIDTLAEVTFLRLTPTRRIFASVLGDGVGQLSAGVYIVIIEDICSCVSRFLAQETRVNDGDDVFFLDPRMHRAWSRDIDNHNIIFARAGESVDHFVLLVIAQQSAVDALHPTTA